MFRVWFIGGPWNNELMQLANLPPCLRIWTPVDGMPVECTDYYPDGQLRTGIPVYSCLWGFQCRERYERLEVQRAEKPPPRQE